jgi:cell division protease FtsH
VGAPGTGKTLLAKAIAGEANVPFLSISGSDFSEMLVGVGPSRMRDLFEEAKLNAPCIIFIDEIDSIARMRGVGVSGVSDENEQTLNQLLVQMDGFTKSEGVIVLAATNRPDVLDQALLRPGRFDRQIIVQMPDVRGREKILEVHCRHKPLGTDVDLKRVAKIISGFTGADIENLMNEAAIIAAKKNKTRINMADITEGINKVLLGPQKRSRIITDEDKKITAFHEAGHAVISRLLQPTQMVQEVSIIPRGMAAGYTITNERDTESHHKTRAFLNTQIAVFMSGRLAEELFTGDICTGSTNDLKHATLLAENMVTKYGMSEKLGPLYYGKHDEIALRMYENARHSEVLQSTIDNEIKAIVLAAEKTARDLLKANAAKVKVMANVLLERETIYAEDIDLIMQGKTEKQIIAEMEKREKTAKDQEKKDRAESNLASLEQQLGVVLETAGVLLENKLIDLEAVVKLEENMNLARKIVSGGGTLEFIPTLDNIDTYANLVKAEVPKAKPAKPTTEKKPQTGKKKNEKSPKSNP